MGTVILSDWLLPDPPKPPRPAIKARYDAATIDDDNRRHWANADGLSARQANSIDVRERLRNHARYEVANNCYARGVVNTLANVTIGSGPTLTMRRTVNTTDAQSDALSETARLFTMWAEEINLWDKLWTMRVAKCQDGEAFALFRTNSSLEGMVQLDLQLLEAEQVTDGYNQIAAFDPKRVDGIDTDDMGNPIAYHVLREHPGDGAQFDTDPITVPARQIIHWVRCDRPGQLRGIPELTPALPLFAQLRRFTLATLTAAETAADFAALLKSTLGADTEDAPAVWDQIPITRGMLTTLPDGYELNQLKAEHPTTTYEMFKREILCEIGRALELPRMMILLDASNYNYASGRLDKQTLDRSIEVERRKCERTVLRKIWSAWFEEASRIPGYLPAEVENGFPAEPRWLWRELGHVDRQKEAGGAAQELTNGTTTLAAECARTGMDWEEVLEQRAFEELRKQQVRTALGLTEPEQEQGAEPNEPAEEPDEVPAD